MPVAHELASSKIGIPCACTPVGYLKWLSQRFDNRRRVILYRSSKSSKAWIGGGTSEPLAVTRTPARKVSPSSSSSTSSSRDSASWSTFRLLGNASGWKGALDAVGSVLPAFRFARPPCAYLKKSNSGGSFESWDMDTFSDFSGFAVVF